MQSERAPSPARARFRALLFAPKVTPARMAVSTAVAASGAENVYRTSTISFGPCVAENGMLAKCVPPVVGSAVAVATSLPLTVTWNVTI